MVRPRAAAFLLASALLGCLEAPSPPASAPATRPGKGVLTLCELDDAGRICMRLGQARFFDVEP